MQHSWLPPWWVLPPQQRTVPAPLALTPTKSGAVVPAHAVAAPGTGASRAQLLDQACTSLEQLRDLLGTVLAGVLTLWLQRQVWRRFERRRPRTASPLHAGRP